MDEVKSQMSYVPYAPLPELKKQDEYICGGSLKLQWEPQIGEYAMTILSITVIRDFGDGWLDVCDSDGNCIKVSRKQLMKSFLDQKTETSMKAMKQAVLDTAKHLLKANNTVTTLEIKTELRRDYPYYFWTQDVVSNYMSQFAGDGIFDFSDNGTYRIYQLSTPMPAKSITTTTNSAVTSVFGKLPKAKKKTNPKYIQQFDIGVYAMDKNFQEVAIYRKGTLITYTKNDIKSQKKSPFGYIVRSLDKVASITVGGKTYLVK